MSKMENELKNDPLMPMRHSCEHVLHMALERLYPSLKKVMGPAIENGFYCDFDYHGVISENDFPRIEEEMKKIVDKDLPIMKVNKKIEEVKEFFSDNNYKKELIDEVQSRHENLSVYSIGDPNYKKTKTLGDIDLCFGPHVSSTGKVGPFKLLSVAGAYWHGNEKNRMLTRIYGT